MRLRARLGKKHCKSKNGTLVGCLQTRRVIEAASSIRLRRHITSYFDVGGFRSAVFVHAMWRTGSTYLWSKFRERREYCAFYEPLNEALLDLTVNDKGSVKDCARLGHPSLAQPYFTEYPVEAAGGVPGLVSRLCYRDYCIETDADDSDLSRYLQRLMVEARSRGQIPMFQFNRSLLRTGWMRRRFVGGHILLLRNPREVWTSFEATSTYFAGAICLILGQNRDHRWLRPIAARWGIPRFCDKEIGREMKFYRRLSTQLGAEMYAVFHAFYILTIIYNLRHVDMVIDMNIVSSSSEGRRSIEMALQSAGVALSLADCRLPSRPVKDCGQWEPVERENIGFLRDYLMAELQLRRAAYEQRIGWVSGELRSAIEAFVV